MSLWNSKIRLKKGLLVHEFYGGLAYKFRRIIGSTDFLEVKKKKKKKTKPKKKKKKKKKKTHTHKTVSRYVKID